MSIKCIDVSTHQGTIDWKKVKASGIGHAILRAGYGRYASQKDAKFEQNYKNAKAAGVKLGVYWYSYAVDVADAKKEAVACLECLKGKTFEMPVFFDAEESSMIKLGKSVITEMAKAFCERIKSGGFRPGVYSNLNWFRNYLDYNALRKLYPIWFAQYYTEPSLECDIWQYTSEGSVSGISGNVDMNIIYNADVVKNTGTVKPKAPAGFETISLQYLLVIAEKLGLTEQTFTPDNLYGKLTTEAVKQAQKAVGMSQTGKASVDFVKKLGTAILANYPIPGDMNGDGKLDITDATAIQKEIAGIERDE